MNREKKISVQTGRLLNFIAIGFLIILARVWYLQIVQNEEKHEASLQPKRRTLTEYVERATIRDRFNIPLAINKIQYNAAIVYAHIREVPHATRTRVNGKKVKELTRLHYIQKLTTMLAKELDLDAEELEDLIHAKASLFPQTPFVIKENLSERLYARLKMLEREWPGIQTIQTSRRFYPKGQVCADVIGYLGAISEQEYLAVADELSALKEYLKAREEGELAVLPMGFQTPLEVRDRLKYLREKAYTINDLVGKSGIERTFDEELRGKRGKKTFEIDAKGNLLRELPGGRPVTPGRRAVLTLSSELQEYAETLLATYEFEKNQSSQESSELRPWIRGGAIVAMDPSNGDILALASYPLFDPNDFVSSTHPFQKEKQGGSIDKWLESPHYIGEIWDGIRPLERVHFNSETKLFEKQTVPLTWDNYLQAILDKNSTLYQVMQKIVTVEHAIRIQQASQNLLHISGQGEMRAMIDVIYAPPDHLTSRRPITEEVKEAIRLHVTHHVEELSVLKNFLHPYFGALPSNDDKLLLLDLCTLAVSQEALSPSLLELLGSLPIASYRKHTQEVSKGRALLKEAMREVFKKTHFKQWREAHFKTFLAEKRKEEKTKKRAPKPYTYWLEKLEKEQFGAFWEEHAATLLHAYFTPPSLHPNTSELSPYLERISHRAASHPPDADLQQLLVQLSPSDAKTYLNDMRAFSDLTRPLHGWHRNIKHRRGKQLEMSLAAAFYPPNGFGFGRSFAFRQATPAGSVFKLITGYEALRQRFMALKKEQARISHLNPLTLVDSIQWAPKNQETRRVMGYWLDGTPIKRFYKGGLMPRGHANIGKIDLPGAFEHSSNIYFSILAGDCIERPNDLNRAASLFGYGSKSGVDLPGEISGHLPDDLPGNKTALYSYAIGQHSLIGTPLQTAAMLSALANGGSLLKPKIIKMLAALEPHEHTHSLFHQAEFPFSEALSKAGITFPLFTEAKMIDTRPFLQYASTQVRRTLFLPPEIKAPLFEGMCRSVHGGQGTARGSLIQFRHKNREAAKDYVAMSPYFIGKTGTAEFFYRPTLDADTKPVIRNHIWFGGIAYPHPVSERGPFEKPELVVVVYLQHGDTGRNAAPLAAQILKKWREIKAFHAKREEK